MRRPVRGQLNSNARRTAVAPACPFNRRQEAWSSRRNSSLARKAPTSMPFQLSKVTSLRLRMQLGRAVVQGNVSLDRRRHRDLRGAGVVAVVDLDRDAEPTLGKGGAEHALGTDLAEHALAETLHHPGVEATGAADHERVAGDRSAQPPAALAWSGSRPTPVPTRAKACARWRSGIA